MIAENASGPEASVEVERLGLGVPARSPNEDVLSTELRRKNVVHDWCREASRRVSSDLLVSVRPRIS